MAADEDWPKMKLEHVETKEDRLVARLISNALLLTLKKLEGKRGKAMRKEGKTALPSIQLEELPVGLIKIHENEDL